MMMTWGSMRVGLSLYFYFKLVTFKIFLLLFMQEMGYFKVDEEEEGEE